jgi:outer membrane receptor protein involved in Fe transport
MDLITRQRVGGTWWWFVTFVLLLVRSMLTAQVTWAQVDKPDVAPVEPVIVTAPRVAIPITQVPAAISVVDQNDVQLGQPTIGLDESIVRIPGIFPQNRFNFAGSSPSLRPASESNRKRLSITF